MLHPDPDIQCCTFTQFYSFWSAPVLAEPDALLEAAEISPVGECIPDNAACSCCSCQYWSRGGLKMYMPLKTPTLHQDMLPLPLYNNPLSGHEGMTITCNVNVNW